MELYMLHIDFLRFCLDQQRELPASASGIDWNEMLVWAERQAIVGIILGGITDARCQKEDGKSRLQIPYEVLMKWIGYANLIENRNKLLNKRCVEVGEYFRAKGFESCILKGQGNAMMYPNPLLRTPGDIDVWVMPDERLRVNGSRLNVKEVIQLAREKNPNGKACYHHVDYGYFKEVEMEVHYRPTFMNNLIANRRLQQWMKAHEDEQFSHKITLPGQEKSISVPTWEFNVVFQLSHIYRHVIQRGVGLRQMIDYYFLLKSGNNNQVHGSWFMVQGFTESLGETLKYLSLYKFAGAVMWVLKEVLGLEDQYLIVPVNERRGRFLYDEMMRGGNFGQYSADSRKPKGRIDQNIDRLKQDLRLVRYFPSECLWEPVFRAWHFFWRLAV